MPNLNTHLQKANSSKKDEFYTQLSDIEKDIRPPFHREFIYKDKQRDAVITTLTNQYPLNVMYWAVREDGNFEVIDGQQRTISVCQYINGDFAYIFRYFHNLQPDEQEQILNYKLMIYLSCLIISMTRTPVPCGYIFNLSLPELVPLSRKRENS